MRANRENQNGDAAKGSNNMIAEIINKSGMESETIKNGASGKNQTSKRNRLSLFGTVIALVLVLGACDKPGGSSGSSSGTDNGNASVIEAKDVVNLPGDNSISKIANVKALISYADLNTFKVTMQEIATGAYENNGFKLTLPSSVSDNYLTNLMSTYANIPTDAKDKITVSDAKAKYGSIIVVAYDNAGKQIGYFLCASSDYYDAMMGGLDNPVYSTNYAYTDKNVTVKGNATIDDGFVMELDCFYKKGWNFIYQKIENKNGVTGASLVTSTKPSGVSFQWYYMGGSLPF